MPQFFVVRRRIDGHSGLAEKSRVVDALVCLTVSGDETCTVHREDDIFMQKVDVMDDLVVAALQEGRINADHRQHSLAGQTSCKGHGMLFGHADIEEAFRMGMTEKLQTCAIFHGGSNGTEGLVGVSGGAERPAKGI